MKPFALLPALLAAALLAGCAGYRLGSMLPADIKTIHVPTFVNKTKEPQIESATTSAAIQEFQKDGSLKIADQGRADAILKVTLTDFRIDPVAFRSQQLERTAAKQYRMTIFASIVMTRRSDDTVIAENPRVYGEYVFDVVGDLSSSKLTALRPTAEDLAHNIVEKVVETWQ